MPQITSTSTSRLRHSFFQVFLLIFPLQSHQSFIHWGNFDPVYSLSQGYLHFIPSLQLWMQRFVSGPGLWHWWVNTETLEGEELPRCRLLKLYFINTYFLSLMIWPAPNLLFLRNCKFCGQMHFCVHTQVLHGLTNISVRKDRWVNVELATVEFTN